MSIFISVSVSRGTQAAAALNSTSHAVFSKSHLASSRSLSIVDSEQLNHTQIRQSVPFLLFQGKTTPTLIFLTFQHSFLTTDSWNPFDNAKSAFYRAYFNEDTHKRQHKKQCIICSPRGRGVQLLETYGNKLNNNTIYLTDPCAIWSSLALCCTYVLSRHLRA